MLKKLIFSSVLISANLIGIAASATQTETAYTTYSRYDERGILLGTISAKTESGYLATRNTYDDSGKLTNVEKGSLRDWQGEGVLPSAWSGFSPISSQSFDYDAYARKVKETTYDNAGKAISLVQMNYDPDGHIQCKAVRMNPDVYNSLPDACTLSAEGVNGPDRISQFTYNFYDKVTSEKRALNTGKVQTYVTNKYDGSYLNYQWDANNNKTELRYDTNARLERVVYPSTTLSANTVNESDYVQFTYDDNGNKLTERKRSGETISYQYDANNRMTVKDYANNTSIKDVCYVYDNRGLQLEAHFGNSTDPATCMAGVGLSNTYYGVGTINTATTNQSGTAQTITYTYDLNGNRDTIKHPDNVLFKYAFDGINRVTGVANEAGAENSLLAVHYGVSGKRSSINRNGSAGATTGFKFDNGVQLNQFTQTLGTPADNFSNNFKYNAANQVIWLKESNTSYSYVGNDDRAGDYTPDGLNRYARAPVPSMGTAPFGYDGNSNLTNDGNTMYSYDAENHLVAASKAGKIVKFEYDPNGRLYQYTSGDGVNHKYLYDNNSLVLEYVNGVVDKRYVHGDQVDEPWAMYTGASVGTANLSYLHTNHQGSIVAYTNASGQVTNKLAYDAYGIPASLNMGTFGYTGQVYLKDLGLYYYKARIYHPQLGRFLQTDPIGYKDDMDLYAYVGNDPVNKTDPTGLCPMCAGAIAGALYEYSVQVSSNLSSGQDLQSSFTNVNAGKILASAALGAVGGGAASLGKAAFTGALKIGGEKIALSGAARVALGVDSTAKVAAVATGQGMIDGKSGDSVAGSITKSVVSMVSGPLVSGVAGMAVQNHEQIKDTASQGVDAANKANGNTQVNSINSQRACTAAKSGGVAMGCN